MRISTIAVSCAVMILFFAPYAHADKLAVFPNNKSLQPLPANVQPDLSGNVHNSVQVAPQAIQQSPQGSPAPVSSGAPSQSGGPDYLLIALAIVAVLMCVGGVFWFIRSGAE